MKSESGKNAAFWWTCYEIWDRWAIKGCQKPRGRRRIISNNRHGLAYIKRPDRGIIELNTIYHQSPCVMNSWEKHMLSMWTAVVNVIRNVLRHAGSRLPCWMYHVLDFVLVFLCFCFFGLLGPSVPCAWLCFCVFFGLCLAWSDCTLWWQHISLPTCIDFA